jgi:hypothetical protein
VVEGRQKDPQGYCHISEDQFNDIKELICGRIFDNNCKEQCCNEIDGIIRNLTTTTYSSYRVSENLQQDGPIFCDPLLVANVGPLRFPAPAMKALRNVDAQIPVRTLQFPNNVN